MTAKRTSTSGKTPAKQVYQLKVTLLDTSPPIWRRIQVPAEATLGELHFVLQVVMGWTNSHLHHFAIEAMHYADPLFELEDARDASRMTLRRVTNRPGSCFGYLYDFGDGWEHEVLVEDILPRQRGTRYPICLAGERACPPEDCGGVWGYEHFLEAVSNPKHPEHDEYLEWVGGEFDANAFDRDGLNATLIGDVKTLASFRL